MTSERLDEHQALGPDGCVLRCRRLEKRFGRVAALRGIDVELESGELFGLLGANGAGKTTLLRCLLTQLTPDAGELRFHDAPLTPRHVQASFGFLPEQFQPPGHLTGEELLVEFAWGLRIERAGVHALLARVGLMAQRAKRIAAYSRGMLQRLGLAMAIVKDPEVLILDEPMLGLDPVGQHQLLSLLRELRARHTTVLLSSHTLSHVERACDRIGVMNEGALVFVGTVEAFLQRHQTRSLEEAFLRQVEPHGPTRGAESLRSFSEGG